MPEFECLPISAEEPVCIGDIVRTKASGPKGRCHRVQIIRECECPFYGCEPMHLHLHLVCVEVDPNTWKQISGQTYHSGYRYKGERLIGMQWPIGSDQNKRNCGEPDELFVVMRHTVPNAVPSVSLPAARPLNPNETLTLFMEGL
jgi:hypothetical protein